jgi:hypothetical protein
MKRGVGRPAKKSLSTYRQYTVPPGMLKYRWPIGICEYFALLTTVHMRKTMYKYIENDMKTERRNATMDEMHIVNDI